VCMQWLMLACLLAICAYGCVPKSQFPTIAMRWRWGLFFFLMFLTITAIWTVL
jgi:hypothetical protein